MQEQENTFRIAVCLFDGLVVYCIWVELKGQHELQYTGDFLCIMCKDVLAQAIWLQRISPGVSCLRH